MAQDILLTGFETRPISMAPLWLVAYQAPEEDVDRIFDEIIKTVPLKHGKTDSNAYVSRGGVEYYRPLEGTPTGAEDAVRHRPSVDEVRFFIPRDTAVLDYDVGQTRVVVMWSTGKMAGLLFETRLTPRGLNSIRTTILTMPGASQIA